MFSIVCVSFFTTAKIIYFSRKRQSSLKIIISPPRRTVRRRPFPSEKRRQGRCTDVRSSRGMTAERLRRTERGERSCETAKFSLLLCKIRSEAWNRTNGRRSPNWGNSALSTNSPAHSPPATGRPWRGVGDDAAVIAASRSEATLVSTDLLMEGIDFDLTYFPLKHLGYKTVTVGAERHPGDERPARTTVAVARRVVEILGRGVAGVLRGCPPGLRGAEHRPGGRRYDRFGDGADRQRHGHRPCQTQ